MWTRPEGPPLAAEADGDARPGLRILTVCTGNVCRSPAAERLLREVVASDSSVTVVSAGTHALVGHGISPPMAERLKALGTEVGGFAARQLTPEMVRDCDLVLAMAREHRSAAVTLYPRAVRRALTLRQLARLVQRLEPGDLASMDDLPTAADRLNNLVTFATGRRGQEYYDPTENDVLDPWAGDESDYTHSLHQIYGAVETLAKAARLR